MSRSRLWSRGQMALEDCGGLKQQVVLPWLQGEAEGPMGRGRRAAPGSGYSSVLSTLALGRGQKPDCGASQQLKRENS